MHFDRYTRAQAAPDRQPCCAGPLLSLISGCLHAIEHQTVQMDVQVGGRAESLDEGDRAGVGCGAFQGCLFEQKPRDCAVDGAQRRREQLGVRREQNSQRDRKRQHPLPDRHEGQNQRRLRPEGSPLGGQENATSFSCAQSAQRTRTRRTPCARMPHSKKHRTRL